MKKEFNGLLMVSGAVLGGMNYSWSGAVIGGIIGYLLEDYLNR